MQTYFAPKCSRTQMSHAKMSALKRQVSGKGLGLTLCVAHSIQSGYMGDARK